MNAAARFISRNHISQTWVISVILTKLQFSVFTLILGVLISGLSMIYVTNLTRDFNVKLQQALVDRNHLHIQWGQLLLEKSTWTMQARVQQVANDKLGMVLPNSQSVVIIKE